MPDRRRLDLFSPRGMTDKPSLLLGINVLQFLSRAKGAWPC